jgi:hypothetical protein
MTDPAPERTAGDLALVMDPLTDAHAVAMAARRLVAVPAQTWKRVADDPAYSLLHRRLCVFELVRRHVQAGMTAARIAVLLDRPAWLRDADVRELGDIGGRPAPVSLAAGDTVTVIDVLPGPAPSSRPWSIYLRWHGMVERAALAAQLRDPATPSAAAGAVLAEIALLPTVADIDAIVDDLDR